MTTSEQLLKSFDGLESDLAKLLTRYRKVKRDRKALLEACKRAMRTLIDDGHDPSMAGGSIDMLRRAISAAESEEGL